MKNVLQSANMQLTLLTLNTWQGGLQFDHVLALIRQVNPDIICLQEVFNGHGNELPRNYRTLDVMSTELQGYQVAFAPAFLCVTAHGKFDQGNAVLSRHPIVHQEFTWLNHGYGEYEEYPDDKDWTRDPKNIQHCQVSIDGKVLNVFNVHGVWDMKGDDTPARLRMSEVIVEQIKGKSHVFLTGDFNVRPDTQTIRTIEQYLRNVSDPHRKTSFNLKFKDLQKSPGYATAVVDFAFVSHDINVISCESPQVDASDHLPLITVLDW